MKINITARHFKAKDSLQEFANTRISELGKYNENILYADVILSYDKPPADTKHCELLIKLSDKKLTAKEAGLDFEKAIDSAVIKIETQLHKYKDKNKTQKKLKAEFKSIET
jgi:putative sigma-54 modulation protein